MVLDNLPEVLVDVYLEMTRPTVEGKEKSIPLYSLLGNKFSEKTREVFLVSPKGLQIDWL